MGTWKKKGSLNFFNLFVFSSQRLFYGLKTPDFSRWSLVVLIRRDASSQILGGGQKGKKIIDLLVRRINDPLSGKDYSFLFLQQLPSLSLGPLKGTVRCLGALSGEVPRQGQEQLTKTLIVRLLNTHYCL